MPNPLETSLSQILSLAYEQHYRGCLVLSGSQAWCQQQALDAITLINAHPIYSSSIDASQVCWVGDSVPPSSYIRAIPPHATAQLLGSDTDCLVIDAWSGFAPDMLGMASGTLRGGALLLLLTPPFDQWPAYDDPDYQRYTALRPNTYKMSGHFLQRTISMLTDAEQTSLAIEKPWLSIVKQDDIVNSTARSVVDKKAVIPLVSASKVAVSEVAASKVAASKVSVCFDPSSEQLSVIDAVKKLSEQSTGMVLLNADRGRGKSVALGLAVKDLLTHSQLRIGIVASLRSQVNNLFAAIGNEANSANLSFMAVDQLITDAAIFQEGPNATAEAGNQQQNSHSEKSIYDVLIVDEAAAIPLPILYQLVDIAPRIIFSSTLHGYEGSGRGFSLRFKDYLLAQNKPLQMLSLIEPIRWASGDPLETFFNQLLILNADSRINDMAKVEPSSIHIRIVSHVELLANEALLRSVFSLLVDAHYQTRPSDLRQLLDVPYLRLWIAECSITKKVIGVLLAYEEGGFTNDYDELLEQIANGKRRPQGNLLSQSLASQTANTHWCQVKSLRVTRIAVAESYRRQGIASKLLTSLDIFAQAEACDYWGSSFGFESRLLAFWQRHEALPVHVGLHRDKASGLRNLMVVKPLTKTFSTLSDALHQQLIIDLPFWHAQYLADISSDTLMLLSNGDSSAALGGLASGYDQGRIKRFVDGELTYDKVYPSLYRMLMSAKSVFSLAGAVSADNSHNPDNSDSSADQVVSYPITQASLRLAPNWSALAEQFQLKGRRDVIASIKTELIQLTMD